MDDSGLNSGMPLVPPSGGSGEAWVSGLSPRDPDGVKAFFQASFRLPLVNPLTSLVLLERTGWRDLRGYWMNTLRGIQLLSLELGRTILSGEKS